MVLNLKKIPLISLLLVFAFVLRLPHLSGSFWLDEAAQALESARHLSQQLDIIPDFQPPLMHLLTYLAMQISHQEWWVRLISALIPGLITIGATYLIAKKLFNKIAGYLSALLLATSSFHIFYSQELRPYSLAAMWGVLSWLALINIWQNSKKSQDQAQTQSSLGLVFKTWWPYIIFTVCGLYSSYTYPFLVLAQLMTGAVLFRRHLKAHIVSVFTAGLLFLPWLPTFLKQLQAGQTLRTLMPGWDQVVSLPQLQALPLVIGKLVFGVLRLQVSLPWISISLGLFLLTLFLLFHLSKQHNSEIKHLLSPQHKPFYLTVLALSLPLLLSWLISFWIPVVRPKRLLFIQPFLYILIADIASSYWQTVKSASQQSSRVLKTLAGLLFTAFLAINLYSTGQYYHRPSLQREDWRGLHQYISARFPERNTILVFGFSAPFAPWQWYAGEQYPTFASGRLHSKNLEEVIAQTQPITDYKFVLVFDYLRDLTDPDNYLVQSVEALGYELHELIDQENIGFVRVYIKN